MKFSNWKDPRSLCSGAFLAGMAAVIQISPLFIPLMGVSLSSLSTLPIAVAAYLNGTLGLLAYFACSGLLLTLSFTQGVIFLFTSGLLGLCLGFLMREKPPFWTILLVATSVLSLGMILTGLLLSLPLFPLLAGSGRSFLIPVLILYSAVYTLVWIPLMASILARLNRYLDLE